MQLHVLHETRYDYAPTVQTARHLAHLRPADTATQRVLAHRLAITPEPDDRSDSVDAFGNTRSFFSLPFAHDRLCVVAESTVATAAPVVPPHSPAWDSVAERLRYRRDTRYDPAAEFSFGSPYVPRDEAFAAYARPSFAAGRPLLEAARELMARIHRDFEYETTATDAGTPALEALALRQGVCQDLAHVMLGALRSLGLAARYVSGYLLTEPPAGAARLVGSDASHAWVAVYVPHEDGADAWVGLDPTNDRAAGEDYVTLATGRDYSDVAPLRGVIRGGAEHTLHVAVTVTPLAGAA
jgi:transglutaminase-like putative cysteine protease